GLPVSPIDAATLRTRELVPFRDGIAAGARLMMLGHLAVPTATDGRVVPATLAPELARDLLRDELGFEGVSVTDALDMGALYATTGPGGVVPDLPAIAVAAAAAGLDLLLTLHDAETEDRALDALIDAARTGFLDAADVAAAAARIRELRIWLGQGERPPLSVVGSAAHADLARETAELAVTLIHDRGTVLPLRPSDGDRVIAISPRPVDLTPADTSSYLRLGLADALRATGLPVDELLMPLDPTPADVAQLLARVPRAESGRSGGPRVVVVVGTIDALVHAGQARLVEALVAGGVSTIAVALRTPVDALAYPVVATALATYGSQPPNLRALADGLIGRFEFTGRLPVGYDPAVATERDRPGVTR
ncbi:MAG TPA: glycoside hydrolase family 3 N-terminal domain-containing protein, partial [Candidatus Acidoferrum sp.]|nr:glycoside hydrolase family 3 N-terminal domain-containing protein [Candidatus Acidoferrum sp.]